MTFGIKRNSLLNNSPASSEEHLPKKATHHPGNAPWPMEITVLLVLQRGNPPVVKKASSTCDICDTQPKVVQSSMVRS
eukprot:s825_g6.t1